MLLYSDNEINKMIEKNINIDGQGIAILNASKYSLKISTRDGIFNINPFVYQSIPIAGQLTFNLINSDIEVNIDLNQYIIIYPMQSFKPIYKTLAPIPIYTYKGAMPV